MKRLTQQQEKKRQKVDKQQEKKGGHHEEEVQPKLKNVKLFLIVKICKRKGKMGLSQKPK